MLQKHRRMPRRESGRRREIRCELSESSGGKRVAEIAGTLRTPPTIIRDVNNVQ